MLNWFTTRPEDERVPGDEGVPGDERDREHGHERGEDAARPDLDGRDTDASPDRSADAFPERATPDEPPAPAVRDEPDGGGRSDEASTTGHAERPSDVETSPAPDLPRNAEPSAPETARDARRDASSRTGEQPDAATGPDAGAGTQDPGGDARTAHAPPDGAPPDGVQPDGAPPDDAVEADDRRPDATARGMPPPAQSRPDGLAHAEARDTALQDASAQDASARAQPPPDSGTGAQGEPARPASQRTGGARVLSVANQKGGVGKTTTAVSVSAALAEAGARVLLVDLDPQGNATTGLGLRVHEGGASSYTVIVEEADVETAIEPTVVRGLHCLPSSLDLAGAEIELVPAFSREQRLRRALDDVRDEYDVVVIDCPPALGLLTVNGLVAADQVLLPIQCEYYALEGVGQLTRSLELVKRGLNGDLTIGGVVLTMFDARTRLSQQVADEVREHFGDVVFRTVIPRTVRLSEAPGFGQPITVFDPSSRGARAYYRLADEVAARLGLQLESLSPLDAIIAGDASDAGTAGEAGRTEREDARTRPEEPAWSARGERDEESHP